MSKILLALVLAFFTLTASALDLTIPLGSYHFDRSKNWQEQNWGIGIDYKHYIAGYYKNSYDRDSVYVGYHLQPDALAINQNLKLGVTMIAVSGYRSSPVLMVPTFSIESEYIKADILFAPALGKASGFIGLQMRIKVMDD